MLRIGSTKLSSHNRMRTIVRNKFMTVLSSKFICA